MEIKRIETLLWNIAFPGFGQFLNGKIIKGTILIALEFWINVQANMNQAIVSSFHGDIQAAIQITDYQWLLFYPCVYLFAMWDAYKDAGGGVAPFSYLPFVFSAFLGTIGVIYSDVLNIRGIILGPIFLPILFLLLGVMLGNIAISGLSTVILGMIIFINKSLRFKNPETLMTHQGNESKTHIVESTN
jgi:hypothetical protein